MHRNAPLIVIVAAAAILLVWGFSPRPTNQEALASPPGPGPLAHELPRLEGVASCASMSCHGGNGPPGSWRSEYTTWAACDPHAHAFEVLCSERSRRMQELLNKGEADPSKHYTADHNPLCLKCHATDIRHHPLSHRFLLSDGVGCESCHGAAGNWIAQHYRLPWKEMSPEEKEKTGFVLTKDLTVRAEVCTRCHVGSVDGAGHPDQEVNHDLIAAGHPRLRFEFGAYHANYPKHWDIHADYKRYPDLQARAWMVGQVTSARAALRLLEARAAATADPAVPWPEFAEHDCYSCHHDLTSPSWRRAEQKPGRLGQLRRNPWYTSMAQTLVAPELTGSLTELDDLMRRRVPTRESVARAADRAAGVFGGLKLPHEGPEEVRGQLLSLVRQGSEPALASPDGAMQFYLAVAALHHALSDFHKTDPGLKGAVQALGHDLNEAFWSPPDKLPREKYDSPRYLDRDRVQKEIQALRAQLGLE
jgi:hypothetical protein